MTSISEDPACTRLASPESRGCPASDKTTASLFDSDINKIVERKLRSNNFRILRWSLDSLGETNGFLGSYYTLSVTVRVDDKSTELKFFAKTPPPNTSLQYEFLIRTGAFNKEIIVYDEIVPRMGRGNGPKWLPDYYLGKNNTIIVLEDAKESGYINPNKFQPFDAEHCIWAVRALSALHSRSLILDEKLRRSTGQTINDIYGHLLKEMGFTENDEQAQKYLLACVKGATAMVDLLEGLDDGERARLKNRVTRWIMAMPKLVKSSDKFRNVICHRDVWVNNIMFKKNHAGRLTGCYLIDYQFIRYNPPAMDFVLCLYLNTVKAIRESHYQTFIDVYCDTMKSELASEGLDMEECLPKAEFIESCQEIKNTALAYSITNLQIMLLTKEAVDEYFSQHNDEMEHVMYGEKRPDLVLSQCRIVKAYQTRLIEILEEIKEHLPDNPPN